MKNIKDEFYEDVHTTAAIRAAATNDGWFPPKPHRTFYRVGHDSLLVMGVHGFTIKEQLKNNLNEKR